MKKILQIWFAVVLIIYSSCKKSEFIDPEFTKVEFTVSTSEKPVNTANATSGVVSISDIEGKYVDCFEFQSNLNEKKFQVKKNSEETFNVSIFAGGRIKTFTDIKSDNIILQTRTDFCNNFTIDPSFIIYFEPEGNDLEKVILSTNDRVKEQLFTTSDQPGNIIPLNVGQCLESKKLFFAAKKKNSGLYRYNLFDHSDSLSIHFDDLGFETMPLIYDFSSYEEAQISTIGIIGNDERNPVGRQYLSRSYNATKDPNYVMEGIYLEEHFERHATRIIFGKDNQAFQLYNIGEPVLEYNPDPIDFEVKRTGIDSFVLERGRNYTLYEVIWKKKYFDRTRQQETTLYWNVYGDFENDLKLPQLNNCQGSLIEPIDLFWEGWSLCFVIEHRYSQFANYQEYLEYHLLQKRDLNRFNEIGGGWNKSLERRTIIY